ncbi:hypothetical protein [Pseudonocardia cypriaca]|uniref:hypothetical protein n=1 Tax=Pseudonocardia cypriaca TaxID=882449 RepID=UPI00114D69A0|nr:hypothetical protein [Pseudonocardia cypriaca]
MRFGGFMAVLALVFGGAWWAGTLAPGALVPPPTGADGHAESRYSGVALDIGSAGLVSSWAGYTLVPRGPTTYTPGTAGELAFVVVGPDGLPFTAFDAKDERQLDLVVAARDGGGFLHPDPVIGPDGVWRAQLTLPAAGVYRAYVDFVAAGGPALVLGMDLFAPGRFSPEGFSTSRTAHVDGYDVRLDADLVAGGTSEVFVAIDRDRLPVTDIEPHLGGLGHLVVLRRSDQAYLRTAAMPPDAAPASAHRAGAGIAFTVEVPGAGEHRLFLEFKHGGAVHTAEFAVRTGSDQ